MLALLSIALFAFTVEQGTLIWAVIGGIGVLATLAYLVGRDLLTRKASGRRQRQLREPCEVHFWIPKTEHGLIGYVQQGADSHMADILVLPSDSEIQIGLWMRPKLIFAESSWYFGFEGALGDKPEPIRYYNPLIYDGIARENSPQQDRTHYIDIHRYYHVIEDRSRLPSEVYVSGFIVRTHKPGNYLAQVFFHGDEARGLLKLHVSVEQPMVTETICVEHPNCSLAPKQQPTSHHGQ